METNQTIHDLDHATVMHIFRGYSRNIALLAKRGDPLSATVKVLYEHLYDHQGDPKAIRGFREALRDWLKMHLEISSRVELARKYGYLVEGEDPKGPTPTIVLQ